jgi:hypothetical protein
LEEFYPNSQEDDGDKASEAAQASSSSLSTQTHNGKLQKPTLRTKLDQRLQAIGG